MFKILTKWTKLTKPDRKNKNLKNSKSVLKLIAHEKKLQFLHFASTQ